MNKNKKQKIKGGFNDNLPITITLIFIVALIIYLLIYNKSDKMSVGDAYGIVEN